MNALELKESGRARHCEQWTQLVHKSCQAWTAPEHGPVKKRKSQNLATWQAWHHCWDHLSRAFFCGDHLFLVLFPVCQG